MLDLKVGDKVGVVAPGGWSHRLENLLTVIRRTPTQVVLKGARERRFNLKTGREMDTSSSKYYTSYLIPAADYIARKEAENLKHQISRMWSTLDQLVKDKNLEQAKIQIDNIETILA